MELVADVASAPVFAAAAGLHPKENVKLNGRSSRLLSFSSPFLYFCVSINFGKISHKIDFFFFVVVVVPFQGGAVKTSGLDV